MTTFISELIGAILQVVLFALIPFLVWLCIGRKQTSFLKWIGLRKIEHTGKWWITILITICIAVVYACSTALISIPFQGEITTAGNTFSGLGISALPAVFVYAFLRTGLSEEILFRGFLLKRISSKCGFVVGNTVQALLFGAMHGIPFGIATSNLFVTILLTLIPGAFGWYQGWLNEKKCGGSILPSWLIHGTMNLIVSCLSL